MMSLLMSMVVIKTSMIELLMVDSVMLELVVKVEGLKIILTKKENIKIKIPLFQDKSDREEYPIKGEALITRRALNV